MAFPTVGTLLWAPPLIAAIQQSSTYNVTDYGAVADGTTDNVTAINATITACNAAGGGTVLVPAAPLAWAKSGPVVMKANVTLMVFGTIKELASSTGAGVTATDVSNTEICGPGTIDMNKAATTNGGNVNTQQGIVVKTSSAGALTGIRIRDITVQNSWQRGVDVEAITAGSSISDVIIDHVTVTACGNMGIYSGGIGAVSPAVSPSHGIWIRRCTVTNPGVDGIRAQGVSDVHIEDNVVTDSGSSTGHGICVGSGAAANTTDHSTDFTVSGNKVRGFVGTGPKWGIAVSARCARFAITGNEVRGCAGGITVDVTDPNSPTSILDVDGTVTGNSIQGSTLSHGFYANSCSSLVVTGNTARGNAGSGIVVATSTGVTVTGNTAKGNTGWGFAIFGTTTGVGGHAFKGNTSTGNTAGRYTTDAAPVASVFDMDLASSAAAETSIANSTAETTLFTGSVPANTPQVGSTYRLTVGLIVDNIATSGALTLRSHWNAVGVTLLSVTIPSQVGAATVQPIFFEMLVTVRAVGASGSVIASGRIQSQFSATTAALGTATPLSINTTLDNSITLTAQWATANAGNVCRVVTAALDPVKT